MSENNSKNSNQKSNGEENTEANNDFNFNFGCGDINGGFQQIYPEAFVVIAQIFGDVIAGRLPFNVQNAVGNWFELVGQAILTYNAQQQYFQGGPGRYFNPIYYNVSNPFCDDGLSTEGNSSSGTYTDKAAGSNDKSESFDRMKNRYSSSFKNKDSQIDDLKKEIENLKSELEIIKNNIGI